jgi:hypothetical protein
MNTNDLKIMAQTLDIRASSEHGVNCEVQTKSALNFQLHLAQIQLI